VGEDYFWGGLWAKLTPFAILPFKPSTAALRRVFSDSSRLVSGLSAFSAPLVYSGCQESTCGILGWEETYT
jgi:hypothetical protein